MFKQIANIHSDKLEAIKTKIEQSYQYMQPNYDTFQKFMMSRLLFQLLKHYKPYTTPFLTASF